MICELDEENCGFGMCRKKQRSSGYNAVVESH